MSSNEIFSGTNNGAKAIQGGMHDAIINGVIHRNIPSKMCYVENENQLTAYANEAPGTFAATYGITKLWQMKSDGSWAVIFGGDS